MGRARASAAKNDAMCVRRMRAPVKVAPIRHHHENNGLKAPEKQNPRSGIAASCGDPFSLVTTDRSVRHRTHRVLPQRADQTGNLPLVERVRLRCPSIVGLKLCPATSQPVTRTPNCSCNCLSTVSRGEAPFPDTRPGTREQCSTDSKIAQSRKFPETSRFKKQFHVLRMLPHSGATRLRSEFRIQAC